MDERLIKIVIVLAVAIVIAILARRLRLPYTVGLVIVGAALAIFKVDFGTTLTHDFIFEAILPPLLFEAALTLNWQELRRDLLLQAATLVLHKVQPLMAIARGASALPKR